MKIASPNKKLAANLKLLMHRHHLTASELARLTNVGQPVIFRMTTGETDNPKIDTLRPIAKQFNLTIDQLIGDAPLPNTHINSHIGCVPLITFSTATQWPSNKVDDQFEHVVTDVPVSDKAFALQAKDRSMEAWFPVGTLLIIDPEAQSQDHDFVIVHRQNQEQATFKQLLHDGADRLLKPLNPDFHTQPLSQDDRIVGTMVQAKINFMPQQ